MLMAGMHHDVGTIKSRPLWVMIQKRPAIRENVPRVIGVKIEHVQPESEVHPGEGVRIDVDHRELALGKDLSMIVELFDSVGLIRRINPPADVDDGLVIRRFHET
jgi:hypothetical protein